jgi:hypothetical protein
VIASLPDAWRWYLSTKALTSVMQRLGKKHWDALPWEGDLGKDEHLHELESVVIVEQVAFVLGDLDDLCVLLLFSVFESVVRDRLLREVESESESVHHPAIRKAIESLKDSIAQGSFFRVMEAYKGADADLIEEVNQVRRYRNWVAHGRSGDKPGGMEPREAFDRLQRFLASLSPASPTS